MTPLMPISSPEEEPPRRRKRARGWPVALEEGEKLTLVEALTERTLPTFDFFLFIFLATLLACVGFGLHSTTLLFAAALVAPLLAPLGGISFGLAVALPRYVGRNLLGVILGVALAFLLAALLGMTSHLVFPRADLRFAESPGEAWADLMVAFFASVWMADRLARDPGQARLPSAALAYLVLIPTMAGGWNLATQGPAASLPPLFSAAASLCLALVGGLAIFLILGIRPLAESPGVWGIALGAIISIGLFLLALEGLSQRPVLELVAQPTSTPQVSLAPGPTLAFTPSPTSTPAAVPSPSVTSSLTPEPTLTPSPTPVLGVVFGTKGKGAELRDGPGGRIVSSLLEGAGVERIGEPQLASGLEWVLVRDGQGHQGWLALEFFATLTPTPMP